MKIICIGEALIDFTPYQKEGTYIRNFGGAPANVAVTASKLGQNAWFIGKVGNDLFGEYIVKELEAQRVDVRYVALTDHACTTLSFVHLSKEGERSFSFIRKPGADLLLSEEDIPDDYCRQGDIVHFGSAQLMSGEGRRAIRKAVRIARECKAVVSFDPNYRALQWASEEEAKARISEFMKYADIVKVSDEEVTWLTGDGDAKQALKKLFSKSNALSVMTCGEWGAYYISPEFSGYLSGYPAKVTDTTGAGDAFWGTFLSVLIQNGCTDGRWPEEVIRRAVRFGNAAGALCVGKKGAIIPDMSRGALEKIVGQKGYG